MRGCQCDSPSLALQSILQSERDGSEGPRSAMPLVRRELGRSALDTTASRHPDLGSSLCGYRSALFSMTRIAISTAARRNERSRVLPNRAPVGVRFLEHTADAAIGVRSRSLGGCFARAAAGMFACFTAPATETAAPQSVEVDVSADGPEELMVAWLEELLYQSEVKGLALHEFAVAHVSRSRVRGSARGPEFGRGAAAVGPGVKAVTRHGLVVRRIGGYWQARVIFDV